MSECPEVQPSGPATLEAGPRATHSYRVNNLFIIALCYVTILSAFSAQKCVNVFEFSDVSQSIHKDGFWQSLV